MAAIGNQVGTVSIKVTPDSRGFKKAVRQVLKKVETQAELGVGLDVDGQRFERDVSRAVDAAQAAAGDVDVQAELDAVDIVGQARDAVRAAERAAGRIDVQAVAGVDVGDLVESVRRAVAVAEQAAGDIDVDLGADSARLVASARAAVEAAEQAVGDIDAGVDIDVAELLVKARAAVEVAEEAVGDIEVDVDVRGASLVMLSGALRRVGSVARRVSLQVSLLSAKVAGLATAAAAASAAIGGLLPVFAAVTAAAASAIVQMGALAAAMAPAAITAGAMALGTLKASLSGFGDVLAAASPEEFAAALSKLPPAAQDGAIALVGLRDQFKQLGTDIQESFWANFRNIGDLSVLMEPLSAATRQLAADMGHAASGVVDFVSHGVGLEAMSDLLEHGGRAAGSLSAALGSVVEGIISVGGAAAPVFEELAAGAERMADQWAQSMAEGFQDGSLHEYFEQAVDRVQAFIDVLGKVGGIFGAVFDAMNAAGTPMLGLLGAMIEQTHAWTTSAEGMSVMTGVFASMRDALAVVAPLVGDLAAAFVGTLVPAAAEAIEAMGPGLGATMDALLEVVDMLAPLLPVLGEAFGQILMAVAPLIPPLAEMVAQFVHFLAPILPVLVEGFAQLIEWVTPLAPLIATLAVAFLAATNPITSVGIAVGVLVSALIGAWPEIVRFAQGVGEWFVEMGRAASDAVQSMVDTVVSWFGWMVDSSVAYIQRLWDGAVSWFGSMVDNLVARAQGMRDSVVDRFRSMVDSAVSRVQGMWEAVVEWFSSLVDGMRSLAVEAWNRVVSAFGGGIDAVLSTVRQFPQAVVGVLGDLGSLLWNAGVSVVQGFIDGMASGLGAVQETASNLVGAARDYFPFSPAKKGPFSGRGWVTYSGRAVGEGFAEGMRAATTSAASASAGLAAAASSGLGSGSVSYPGPGDGAGGRSGAGDYSIHIGSVVAADPDAPMREVRRMNEMQRVKAGL